MLIKPKGGLANRRDVLWMGASAGLLTALVPRAGFAQDYPSRNFNVVIATGQGGIAEVAARNFAVVMREEFGVEFEFEFHPGAGGQVGYELYAHRREKDGHNLLFSNMNSEVITYALQDTNYHLPGDITHFAKVYGTPIVMYVGAESPIRTIEELVEEGLRRTVNISTSRLPHPGSIGVLALAEATGADFNLIPFGGGNPTSMAAITGEVDCAVLTGGSAIALGDQVRTIATFRDVPALMAQMDNAPLVNDVFGTSIPELELASAWAIHTEVWENQHEVRERLQKSIRSAFDDPRLRDAFEQSGYPWDAVEYGDADECARIVQSTIALADRYRNLLVEV